MARFRNYPIQCARGSENYEFDYAIDSQYFNLFHSDPRPFKVFEEFTIEDRQGVELCYFSPYIFRKAKIVHKTNLVSMFEVEIRHSNFECYKWWYSLDALDEFRWADYQKEAAS